MTACGYNGRLGNQLWQMASTIGRALDDGAQPVFNPGWEYRPYFSVPDEFFGKIQNKKTSTDFSKPQRGYVDYMQRFDEFSAHEDFIREIFQPSDLSKQGISERWPDLYKNYDKKKISLHIRRGDYVQHADLFPAPTKKYRTDAIYDYLYSSGVDFDTLDEAYEQIDILVFSDDIAWCKRNQPDRFTFIEGVSRPVEVRNRKGQPEDQYDLFLMADCDYHVIANSSYSWWGAFLSGNEIVAYPSVWFGEGIPEYDVWEKMIPSTWKKFEC